MKSSGKDKLPICVAKTQYSRRTTRKSSAVRRASHSRYAMSACRQAPGFIVALTGDIMTMPGLPKQPAAYKIDVDDDGNVSGLF